MLCGVYFIIHQKLQHHSDKCFLKELSLSIVDNLIILGKQIINNLIVSKKILNNMILGRQILNNLILGLLILNNMILGRLILNNLILGIQILKLSWNSPISCVRQKLDSKLDALHHFINSLNFDKKFPLFLLRIT